jgi:hypothetical protein
MTLRLFRFRISAERSFHFTRASYFCGLQGSRGIITAVDTHHQLRAINPGFSSRSVGIGDITICPIETAYLAIKNLSSEPHAAQL